jgi:hypothetical protein
MWMRLVAGDVVPERIGILLQGTQFSSGTAKTPGYIKDISGPGARSQKGSTARDRT